MSAPKSSGGLTHAHALPVSRDIHTYTQFGSTFEPWEYTDWIDESMSWKDTLYIGDWSPLAKMRVRGREASQLSGRHPAGSAADEERSGQHRQADDGDGDRPRPPGGQRRFALGDVVGVRDDLVEDRQVGQVPAVGVAGLRQVGGDAVAAPDTGVGPRHRHRHEQRNDTHQEQRHTGDHDQPSQIHDVGNAQLPDAETRSMESRDRTGLGGTPVSVLS